MKVACIIHSLCGGGAERVMAGLACRLAQRNHQLTLITLDDGQHDRYQINPEIERRCLNVMSEGGRVTTRIRNTRTRIQALTQAIEQASPDVALSFCDRTNILTLLAARKLTVPVVVSERSEPSQQNLGRFWEWMRGRTYSRADAIVALTEHSASYLRNRLGAKVVVIPSAIETPPNISDRSVAQSNRRIVGVGRLEKEKGFDRLLEAFSDYIVRAPEDHQDWNLRIIGEGSIRDRLESRIDELGLAQRVTLPGWIQPVWDELTQATLFVLPSRYEGFPSSLLEAMAAGVPSIAVDCPSGPGAVIDSGVNGLLVQNDVSSLSAGILRMIQAAEAREQLGVAGRQIIDRFDWDSMVSAYEQLLESTIANARAARDGL